MEELYTTYRQLIDRTPVSFVRYLHDQIDWSCRLIALIGSRGVGKSTLLLQHIKLHEQREECLYVLADDFYFTTHRLYDLAKSFVQLGGKKLYIDEIHKYKGWSTEIKNIYDKLGVSSLKQLQQFVAILNSGSGSAPDSAPDEK